MLMGLLFIGGTFLFHKTWSIPTESEQIIATNFLSLNSVLWFIPRHSFTSFYLNRFRKAIYKNFLPPGIYGFNMILISFR